MELTKRLMSLNLVFFGLAFLYMWFWVEPHLFYHGFGTILSDAPVFSMGWAFAKQSLSMPAGVIVYVSGFLSQGYHYSWVGALVIVLTAALLCGLSKWHFAHAGAPHHSLLTCFPAIFFFLIVNQYRHPLAACLTVTMGLLFSLVFEKFPWRQAAIRIVAFGLMAAAGYALMGAGGVLVFVFMTVIYSVFIHRQWWLALFVLPAGVALVWFLAEYVYLLPSRSAFRVTMPLPESLAADMPSLSMTLLVALYAFVPVTVSITFLGRLVWSRKRNSRTGKARGKKARDLPKSKGRPRAFVGRVALSALPMVLLAVGLTLTSDSLHKDFLRANAHARQRRWPELLELARRLPKGRTNIACNHDINRALYHMGRLPYEMFSFPQNPHALLLTHEAKASSLTQLQLCEVFMELGNLNTAEKMASELLALQGHRGIALEKLAWISIIKERPDTARVYLNVLRKDPLYHDRAEAMLDGLDGGFEADQIAYITKIRSYVPDDPYGATYGGSVEQILTGLLEQNPHNKMAFEYLMACHLLTRQLDKVIANMNRLDDLGYEGIPIYYEEALLIHCTMRRQPIDLAKLGISPATYQRCQLFLQITQSVQASNQQAAMNRLIREFGSSYFFYYGFGRVGVAAWDAGSSGEERDNVASPRRLAKAK